MKGIQKIIDGVSEESLRAYNKCKFCSMYSGVPFRMLPLSAGHGRGEECAIASAKLENAIRPNMILINTMTAFNVCQEHICPGKS